MNGQQHDQSGPQSVFPRRVSGQFGSRPPQSLPPSLAEPPSQKTGKKVSIGRVCLTVTLFVLFGSAWGAYSWFDNLGIWDFDQSQLQVITESKEVDNTLVFDRNGRKIGEFFSNYHVYVPFEEMPKNLINAIVAIEDKNFWSHQGIDIQGMARALWVYLRGSGKRQGASTITQQLVRHFLLSNEKTVSRKFQEIVLALRLERMTTKEKIFEIYANTMFLGNGSYGVGAAAQRYFAKSVKELQTEEAALIAGLFQSPSRYNPVRYPDRAKARQNQVLKAMARLKMMDQKKLAEMIKKPLEYKDYHPLNATVAPYLMDYVEEKARTVLKSTNANIKNKGYRIYTTLDSTLQEAARATIEESANLFKDAERLALPTRDAAGDLKKPSIEGAILVTDPRNGEILAMVGGRDYARSQFNRTVAASRSPGSAFKPVVYSLALERGKKWSDVVFVSPITIETYRPRTPENEYLTETTLLRAFYRSMNGPTVELGQELGLSSVIDHAKKFGFTSEIKREFGSILGSSVVTMVEMARMYSVFANKGTLVKTVSILKIVDRTGNVVYEAQPLAKRSVQVLSPEIAYLMTQGMKDVFRHGTGYRAYQMAEFAAGKTGTSNEAKDNWFCGYTPNLTAVVWVGTDEYTEIPGAAGGATMALPIWEKFITKALKVRETPLFEKPSSIVSRRVHQNYGHVSSSGITMFFIEGQEPPEEQSALETLDKPGSYRDVFAH